MTDTWTPVTPEFWGGLTPSAVKRIRAHVGRMRVRLKRRIGIYRARDARLHVRVVDGKPRFALIGPA